MELNEEQRVRLIKLCIDMTVNKRTMCKDIDSLRDVKLLLPTKLASDGELQSYIESRVEQLDSERILHYRHLVQVGG